MYGSSNNFVFYQRLSNKTIAPAFVTIEVLDASNKTTENYSYAIYNNTLQALGGHVSHRHGKASKTYLQQKKQAQHRHEEPVVPNTTSSKVAVHFVHEEPEIHSPATKEAATPYAHEWYELHGSATSQVATKHEHEVATPSSLLGSSQVAARTSEVATRDRVAKAMETKLQGLLKGPSNATAATDLPTVPEHEAGAGSKGNEAAKATDNGPALAIAAVTAVVGGLALCGIAKKLKPKDAVPKSTEPGQQRYSIMDDPGYGTCFLA